MSESMVFPVCLLRWVDSCQAQARDTCHLGLSPPSLFLRSAYHGHLSSLIDISPYKFRDLDGQKEWVHVVCTAQGGPRSVPAPSLDDTALSFHTHRHLSQTPTVAPTGRTTPIQLRRMPAR